jgi:hypothetical protein
MSSPRRWFVDTLPWIVAGLLLLWIPPVITAIAAGVGGIRGQGYPALTSPDVVLPAVELVLLGWAIPGLRRRALGAWRLLAWSRVIVFVQASWSILVNTRLTGFGATMATRTAREHIVGLVVAVLLLAWIRSEYVGHAGVTLAART